ncbi:MAG TPA: hypothetical protein VLS89_09820 [Candidatus Nanopelagicales bacterium]|nr:hypothetical protein [Candidatus Nanopelagicales bacterium]
MALRKPPRPTHLPDLSLLEGIVAPRVLDALRAASQQLTRVGIRHALVGGLAVGAHGHPRATKDVDFLVGDEAFAHHGGGLVTIAPGVPVQVGDVAVDPISIAPDERHLDAAVATPAVSDGIPIAPIEALLYMKLKSPRRKDSADIVELVKAGVATAPTRRYLEQIAPDLIDKFDMLVSEAIADDEG